ncbi:hypothetical protein LTR08_003905 [Meristemomyces frigidus]|nr:hypothetical protein LTR08_003905 [Meristemomyces frigidus]
MAVSFAEARKIIRSIGAERSIRIAQDEEMVTLDQAAGRVSKDGIVSPINTPTFDSATMHGYAVIAQQASYATPAHPLHLRVLGITAAGDAPLMVDDQIYSGTIPCVEVRVGAPFPTARSNGRPFDGLIAIEHTQIIQEGGQGRIVRASNPPLTSWHKRIVGSDFRQGDIILAKGVVVEPKHVMALASVGFKDIAAVREIRVGVISVGSELVTAMVQDQHLYQQPAAPHKIPDSNGYYLTSILRDMGVEGIYLGAVPSDAQILTSYLRDRLVHSRFDIIIATEGAMSGQMEQIPKCIEMLKGAVHFRQVMMNPGSEVIFASLPSMDPTSALLPMENNFYGPAAVLGADDFFTPPKTPGQAGQVVDGNSPAFFGLLGAPIASAAAFRFIITPYIRHLSGTPEEQAVMGKVMQAESSFMRQTPNRSTGTPAPAELLAKGHTHVDVFRHGTVRSYHSGVVVEISREQSPAKTSPFASSNGWVHIPRGHVGMSAGDVAEIFPFCSPKS